MNAGVALGLATAPSRRALVLLACAWCAVAPPAIAQSLPSRMIAAEDARVASETAIAPLLQGVRSADATIAAQAVRGLGRFERPALLPHILPVLADNRPRVRREAANALGQSLATVSRAADRPLPPEVGMASRALLGRARVEQDPYVLGTIVETLGRLPLRAPADLREVERVARDLLPAGESEAPTAAARNPSPHPAAMAGAVKGLESLIRLNQKVQAAEPATINRLRAAATLVSDPADADFAVVRRLAWTAMAGAGAANVAVISRGAVDPDSQVRRLAIAAMVNVQATDSERRMILAAALRDAAANVRYEALRVYGRTLQARDCGPVLAALDDRDVHVALAAVDQLGAGCPDQSVAVLRLVALADSLPADGVAWHKPAHALVALARINREQATPRLARFAEHRAWQVRVYAARAATQLLAAARLERLAADPNDNVRYEAILGLRAARGHDADTVFMESLARPDYQLVLTAAAALEGSPRRADVTTAVLKAFARITAEARDTSRDVRMALLTRARESGSRDNAAALQNCLSDFDATVAAECAAILRAWTGVQPPIHPAPFQPQPVAGALPVAARVVMRRAGAFELRLLPEDAPATVARVARLARQGYYNGLLVHRVVPNFVVQGGGPGGNEYSGDSRYMRDELGLRSHTRGTVGISTRGRDTGDAQFFINLQDNPRLDHEFTVFAEVTAGMAVVDGILEDDVIDRVDILPPPASPR
jgi:cyclophilin family peptidyl-prolyl cis-trans isomerase/HEAT repeat protein